MQATIQVMQPHWTGPEASAHLERFWSAIDSDPACVVTVAVFDGDTWELRGIFSTRRLAMDWVAEQNAPTLVTPKRVDCPDWGSATAH
jgi:hypothetical protein